MPFLLLPNARNSDTRSHAERKMLILETLLYKEGLLCGQVRKDSSKGSKDIPDSP